MVLPADDWARSVSNTLNLWQNIRGHLRRLIKSLQAGDVMMVTAIYRGARNTRDLLNILDEVSRAEAKFKSLSEPWCDSTSPRVS